MRLLQQQARAGDAGLTRRGENAGDRAADGIVEDAIVEHDVGRLAAELQRHFLETLGCKLVHARARRRAAGEGDLGDLGMRHQRLAHHGAIAGHDIDHAGRQAQFLDHELHEFEQRGGCELGWFDHHRAAGRQRRRQLPGRQHQGRVPWRDERTHADRLFEDVGEVIGPIDRHHRALDFIRQAAVVVEPLRHVLGLRHHLRDQLAVVAHFDLAQVVGMFFDELSDAPHHLAARRRCHLRPWPALEGARGRFDSPVGIRLVAFGDQRPGLARVGVVGLKLLAGGRIDPLAVDVGLVLLQLGGPVQHDVPPQG